MTRHYDSETASEERSNRAGFLAVILVAVMIGLGALGFNLDDLTGRENSAESIAQELDIIEDSQSRDWYDIYFTNPTCPATSDRAGGLDEIIADDILSAQLSVDIVAYDLDSDPIIDALIQQEENGIPVRVVVDNQHTPEFSINRLRRNGISVIEDKRQAFMHNKYVVIDNRFVWTGSMNFSSNGVYCNNNHVVRFDSPKLAENYGLETDEMYIDQEFGPRSPENTDNRLTIAGVEIENYFSAEQEVAPVLARLIARADIEVLVMSFSFTNEDIGEALIERAEDGVSVRGVMEKTQAGSTFSYYNDFRRANIDNLQVLEDGNSRVMHHKVLIIDRSITVIGSFNFSNNANESNDENVVIIYDEEFAQPFIEEFELIWIEAGG